MSEPVFVYDPKLDGDADPGEVVWGLTVVTHNVHRP